MSENDSRIDAATLIRDDLRAVQRARRRHFLPALGVVLLFFGVMVAMMGLRPDLFEQPPWQLALQCAMWGMCLLVLPAIGVGLWFPSTGARVGVIATTVVLVLLATLGWPLPTVADGDFGVAGCAGMIGMYAVVVLLAGVVSGAFIQRRRAVAAYWVAAGVALTALNAITWHCPMTGAAHVMPNHLAPAIALMLVSSAVGWWLHRRQARTA